MKQFKVGDKVTGEGIDGVGIIKTANELDNEYEVEYLTETADWFSREDMSLLETKTADEMLLELGYVLQEDESDGCQYVYKNGYITLVIDVEDCEYYIENTNEECMSIGFKEHKAIHKQMQELGWI